MTIQNLKVGDKLTHYCSGEIVEGIVKNIGIDFVVTKHDPIRWGENYFTETTIQKSTVLQYKTSQTTPGAWFKGKKLKA